jgi:sn-glycerol 3-phosphate transport system permease protein
VVSSLLPKEDAISYPPKLWAPDPQWGNYKKAMEAVPLGRYMFNSFVQSGIITIGQLFTATIAAYAFAFMRFPLRNFLFVLFLSTLMVPWEASIIPNFQTVQRMGDVMGGYILSLDSYQALTIPFLATAFGTFLMRQHFMTIPLELRDAASIDGYGHLRFLWHVVLPLSKPALGTLAVFAFLQSWNQYLWPLLVTNSDDYRTVQIGLAGLASQEIDSINVVMAGTVIALLPMLIIIVLFQRQLVRGLMSGALKG